MQSAAFPRKHLGHRILVRLALSHGALHRQFPTVVEGAVRVDLNEQKEQLSYAYIHLVASVAGCTFAFREDGDALGIDITIMGFKELEQGIIIPIPIDAQVKSTSRSTIAERYIHYDLKVKNYNELRVEQYGSPRILIVVVLPDDPEGWLDQSEERLVLRDCAAYWMSLRGASETTNTSSIRVDVPCANLFTTESLARLLQVTVIASRHSDRRGRGGRHGP